MNINFADSWDKSWTFWHQFIEFFFQQVQSSCTCTFTTYDKRLSFKQWFLIPMAETATLILNLFFHRTTCYNNRIFILLRTWFSLKVVSFKFTPMSSKSTELSMNVAFQFEAVSSDFSEPFKQWMSVPTGHHPFLPAEFHVEVVVCSRHRTHTANLPAHLKQESQKMEITLKSL